jgi:galactose-1-phosphate uridylyltransferase
MELRRETHTGEILDPLHGFAPLRTSVEVRWDPLVGYASRLVHGRAPLLPPAGADLAELAARTREGCPFCTERVMTMTPRLPVRVHPAGRIRRGEALLFPNLLTYWQHSAVSIYSPERHLLPLDEMDATLVSDNLGTQVDFIRAVAAADPAASWASINANHLPPSGSSLFHPHLQGGADPQPSTLQALFAKVSAERFEEYLRTERRIGQRFIGSTGRIRWLASFAPIGFHEVRAVVAGAASPAQLDEPAVQELGRGIAAILNLYAELGHQSFNMALFGAPAGRDTLLNLRLVCRSNLGDAYRSDVMYSERLHWQAMVDTSPEELAERARARFGR